MSGAGPSGWGRPPVWPGSTRRAPRSVRAAFHDALHLASAHHADGGGGRLCLGWDIDNRATAKVEARLVGHRADVRRATDEDRFDDLLPFGIHRPFERIGFMGPDHGRGDRGNILGAGDQAFEFPVAELAARNVRFRCIVSLAGQIGPLACRYPRGRYVGWRGV